jgi:small subunit ribosomal protein S6e
MAEFKIVVSDPTSGRSYKVDISGGSAGALIGKKVGDEVDAAPLGFQGYKVKITGASDRNGTPVKPNLPGTARRRLLLASGVGYNPRLEGERRRKSIRGNEISPEIVQINAMVTSRGDKPLEEYFAKPESPEKVE